MSLSFPIYMKKFFDMMSEVEHEDVCKFGNYVLQALQDEVGVYVFGNGGSFSNAMHFCNDIQGICIENAKQSNVRALGVNGATLSALSNDYGYELAIQRYLQLLAKRNDLFIAISCSGKSENILSAIRYARDNNVKSLALSTAHGAPLTDLADFSVRVRTQDPATAESAHSLILDYVTKIIRESLDKRSDAN